MSGGHRPPPYEDSGGGANSSLRIGKQNADFRVPNANSAASNWLRATYQIDNNVAAGSTSCTTTTTRHFAAWEQTTTTHFPNRGLEGGQHSHPLLAASISLNSPVIRPIPNRLASPPESKVSVPNHVIKLETPPPPLPLLLQSPRPLLGGEVDTSTDGNDSAFEDWESCSRTTPINHKSIRKWRQQSGPGPHGSLGSNGSRKSSLASTPPSSFQPISIMTSTPLDSNGPSSAPSMIHAWQRYAASSSPNPSVDSLFTSPASSESSSKKRLKSETVTSPDSVSSLEDNNRANIPVGIAVARQRGHQTASTPICDKSNGLSNSSLENSSLNDSGIEMKRPLAPPPPAHASQPQTQRSASENFLDSWLRQPQLWPLSYPAPAIGGYQFVKDPLTGQMFFVPSFGTPTAALWPPPAPAAPAAPSVASAASYGLTPFQQSLMQLQQESLLVRQFASGLFGGHSPMTSATSRPSSPLRPSAPPPPKIESPDIKLTPPATSVSEDDNLSVGDEIPEKADMKAEFKAEAATPEVRVKTEASNNPEVNGLNLLADTVLKTPQKQEPQRPSRLGLLCDAAFLSDDEGHLKTSTPLKMTSEDIKQRSRSLDSPYKTVRTLSSDYRSPQAERNAKAFIASKSTKMSDDLVLEANALPLEAGNGTISDKKMTSRIKMADWERKMRGDLADIQKKYKEKYKELYKLQHKSANNCNNGNHKKANSPMKQPLPAKNLGSHQSMVAKFQAESEWTASI